MIVQGGSKEFRQYLGTGFFGNLIKYKTRNADAKRNLTCEGVNGVPHEVKVKGEIRFCHPPGRSRLDMLDVILHSKYKISGTGENAVFRCDLALLTADFWQAHAQMIAEKAGKFLCGKCDRQYR